jgi:hypothetical protein
VDVCLESIFWPGNSKAKMKNHVKIYELRFDRLHNENEND